jgi:cytochrome P450
MHALFIYRSKDVYTIIILYLLLIHYNIIIIIIMHLSIYSAGYRIPKGTNIAINHWALHHDPSAWDDVDRFIPERYLGEDGKLGPKPKNWLPFSAGTRVCLGEFVAKPELHLIFASLMQRYKWKMESGLCADITPVGSAFSLGCKPFKVIAKRRS